MRSIHLILVTFYLLTLSELSFSQSTSQGQFDSAFENYQRIFSELSDTNNQNYSLALEDAARTAYELGNELLEDDELIAALAINYANASNNLDASESALEYAMQLLEGLYSKESEELVDIYMALGDFYTQNANNSKAESYYKKVIKIMEETTENYMKMANMNYYIGNNFFGIHDYRRAKKYIVDATEYYLLEDSTSSLQGLVQALLINAVIEVNQRRLRQAEKKLLEIIPLIQTGNVDPLWVESTYKTLINFYDMTDKLNLIDPYIIELGKLFANDESDNVIVPIVTRIPTYPQNEVNRGGEGWVMVRFTISEEGRALNPVVVEYEGGEGFAKAVLDAVVKFRYIPQYESGIPVSTAGVKYEFNFSVQE